MQFIFRPSCSFHVWIQSNPVTVRRKAFLVSRKPCHRGSFLGAFWSQPGGRGAGECPSNYKSSHLISLWTIQCANFFLFYFYLSLWEALWDTCTYATLHVVHREENGGWWRQVETLQDKHRGWWSQRGNMAEASITKMPSVHFHPIPWECLLCLGGTLNQRDIEFMYLSL